MLGRLLQSAATTFAPHGVSKHQPPLESVTEEAYTSELLYPEVSYLRHGLPSAFSFNDGRTPYSAREAANYDDRGGLNIAYPADVRFIIAQDANSRHPQPQVLYDSMPPPTVVVTPQQTPPKSAGDGRSRQEWGWSRRPAASTSTSTTPKHQRHSSAFQYSQLQGSSPTSPRSPDFRFRRGFGENAPPRSSTFEVNASESETAQGRIAREGKEDTEALLSCMFGAPGFRLEPGTKLHVIPRKAPSSTTQGDSSSATNRPDSSGGFSRQRTPLIRSTSAADVTNTASANAGGSERNLLSSSKSSLVITRLFSVQISDTEVAESDDMSGRDGLCGTQESIYSRSSQEASDSTTTSGQKQIKTPMFAIAVILQLPNDNPRSMLRKGNFHQEISSLGSSYDYMSQSPDGIWKPNYIPSSRVMNTQPNGVALGAYNAANVHISKVLAHWNIIGKALSTLEMVARSRLRDILVYQNSLLPPLISTASSAASIKKPKKVKQTIQQSIQVNPECLQNCAFIQAGVESTGQRIICGLRTRRVVTGQGRWGAWREEARWVGRWAGGKDQNFFFFNLLTAFLGSHTVWMDSLVPSAHKRQAGVRHYSRYQDNDIIHYRTVVVSEDKMAARRLIFLLAAFLPNTHIPPGLEINQWSHFKNPGLLYSQSPTSIPTIRDYSQRRTPTFRQNGTRKVETAGHARSVSFSLENTEDGSNHGGTYPGQSRHERRVSDARSIRGASLAIPTNGTSTQKTSTSTVIADTAIPVPHFSNYRNMNKPESQRRESRGSLASVALNHTLKQSDSAGLSNTSGSGGRFGSMVSGFWSIRRGSSTDESDAFASSQKGLANSYFRKDQVKSPESSRLDRMVEDIAASSTKEESPRLETQENRGKSTHPQQSQNEEDVFPIEVTKARSIPETPKAKQTPLKLSVNEQDGTIDIELPSTGSFASSLTSSFGSSFLHRTAPSSLQDHFSPYGRPVTPDSPRLTTEPSVDVAGWLKRYHENFSLQAVRPYGGLEEDVKQSMIVEARVASQNFSESNSGLLDDQWTEVSSTLIADTTNFSIKRLRLRRRRKTLTTTSSDEGSNFADRQTDSSFEDSVMTEPLMDMDPTLIDAVERVLAQSGRSSRAHSRAPSPVRSEHRSASTVEGPALEIPHGECRRIVLGALEQVVRNVGEEMSGGRGREGGDGVRRH